MDEACQSGIFIIVALLKKFIKKKCIFICLHCCTIYGSILYSRLGIIAEVIECFFFFFRLFRKHKKAEPFVNSFNQKKLKLSFFSGATGDVIVLD